MFRKSPAPVIRGLTIFLIVMLLACSDDNPAADNESRQVLLTVTAPADEAVDQPLLVTLSWSPVGDDDDEIWYTVYLGTDNEPGVVADSITATSYKPPLLAPETHYRWRVMAHCGSGCERLSAMWSFGTGKGTFVYPTYLGSRWYYDGTVTYDNPVPDSVSAYLPRNGLLWNEVYLNRMDTIDTVPVYVFDEEMGNYEIQDIALGMACFTNEIDGLYFYGLFFGTQVTPYKLSVPSTQFRFGKETYSSQQDLNAAVAGWGLLAGPAKSVATYDSGFLRSIAYPPEEGYQWNYREAGNPWLIDKRYLEPQEVQTPAGTFQCYVISWLYDRDADGVWDDDIEVYDYICDIGLVRRTYTVYGVGIVEDGIILGTCDITVDYSLTGYYIEAGW